MADEEFESQLDEQLDLPGEGLRTADELDLAQDLEDRQAAASQEETAKEEETEEERFAYTLKNGQEIEGTFEEITQAIADEAKAEAQAEVAAKSPEKPAEGKEEARGAVDETLAVPPTDWGQVGSVLTTMLEGGDPEKGIGGVESIGPALQDLTYRTFMTDPRFAMVLEGFIEEHLSQREGKSKAETSLKEFAGGEFQAAEITAFQKENPWAKSKEAAIAGLKAMALQKEIDTLKAGKPGEVAAAKKAGSQETIKSLKAKGQLRRLSGTGRKGGPPPGGKVDLTNEGQRVRAMTEHVLKMRGQAT